VIDHNSVETELKNDAQVIVQFSGKVYSDKMLNEINDLCSKYNENFSVRFYGFYSSVFDCKVVEKIPRVKSLYIDCLMKAENLDSLTTLQYLKLLSIGVYQLEDTEILKADNFKNLKELIISETKTKSINLKYLKEYQNLQSLFINSHTKNIDAVGELSNLEYLSLASISKVPISFVNKLKKLKTLRIILGGRENIDEIEENEIEYLEINRVRGFNKFKNVSNFKKLRDLLIEDQIQLGELNFDKPLSDLEDIKILNCKTFNSLTGLEKLPKLHQLRIYQTSLDFKTFIRQKRPESLKILAFYTTKKVDKEIKEELKQLGYTDGLDRVQ
jgi:protein phosphatase 1 regulatory subunit 7